MRLALLISLVALGACKAEDATGMWGGTTTTSTLGIEQTYDLLIDIVVDDKELIGDGILTIGGLGDAEVEVSGTQKRKKLKMDLDYIEGFDLGPAVKLKGKIKDGEIEATFSVGVSVVKTKADMILTRQ